MTAGRPLSDLTTQIVAAWFDERCHSAAQVAERLGCSRESVYTCWKRAQKRGQVPTERRDSYFLRLREAQFTNFPHDFPITVDTRGAADPLLRELKLHHAFDPRRMADDLTERLASIAQRASRGVKTGEFLA